MDCNSPVATRKLYYEDGDTLECVSTVLSAVEAAGGTTELVLDSSPFYPEGGGQPCDLGTIGSVAVQSVSEDRGVIRHAVAGTPSDLEALGVAAGKQVRCSVDPARREDHSAQHSCQHLLSSVVLRLLGGATKSFHLGPSWSSIDVDLPRIEARDLLEVEAAVGAIILEGYRFVTHECNPEQAAVLPLRRKVPEVEGVIRVVEIDGLDFTPCCGTHVGDSAELIACRLLKAEKYKGMTRIYFIAGRRALSDYRKLAESAATIAGSLGCGEPEIAALVAAQKDKLAETEYALKTMQGSCAGYQAKLLSLESPDAFIVEVSSLDYPFDYASSLSKALAALGKAAFISCQGGLRAALAAPAAGPNLAGLLKPLLLAGNVKGGGGPTFFQVSADSAQSLAIFLASAKALILDQRHP